MFSKQRQSQNSPISTKSSPLKRQRSDSPILESELVAESKTAQSEIKKRKTEVNNIAVVEGPSTMAKVSHKVDSRSLGCTLNQLLG